MNVVSNGPLLVSSLVWQPRAGTFVLTIVAKATFRLAPGVSPLAEHQDEPNPEDSYWNDDLTRSVSAPNDLVPYKGRVDVLLVGHAFAPRNEPVRSLKARLAVAGMDKTIEIFADRSLLPDGTVREAPPFVKMPIRYERAAAGPANPVGIRPDARADRFGAVPLPNLQQPGLPPIHRSDAIAPIGFGPIAPTWPARLARMPTRGSTTPLDYAHHPLPEGLDPLYFNAAPPDQQVDRLHAGEGLILENLHPQYPFLRTSLPGVSPKAIVERAGKTDDLPMNADTLWVDTDRGVCAVTWRGQLWLEAPDTPGHVIVSTIKQATRESFSSISAVSELPSPQMPPAELNPTATYTLSEAKGLVRALGTEVDSEMGEITLRPARSKAGALPFKASPPQDTQSASPERAPASDAIPIDNESGATVVGQIGSQIGPILPFGHGGEASAAPAPPSSSSSAITADLPKPPAMVYAPPAPLPASHAIKSPWASGPSSKTQDASPQPSANPANIAPPLLPLEDAPRVGREPAAAAASSVAVSSPAERSPKAPKIGSVAALKQAGVTPGAVALGAVAASNAAADPRAPSLKTAAAPHSSSSLRPRTSVELLWFERAFLDAIRRAPAFRSAVTEPKNPTEKADEKKPPGKPASGDAEPKDRSDIAAVCALGEPSNIDELSAAMAAAVDERGMFSPPMVLLGGDIELPFDEVETLKATVAAVTPLAAGDKKLKETIDAVSELMKTPWLQSAGSVTERLTAQVKEAFASSSRLVPQGYLESHTERILLEQRHYQKRTLLGQIWIRALLAPAGSSIRVPAYLPQALARELPMFQQFPVRVIAEARPQLDQYEAYPIGLRVVALARVLDLVGRR